jgi:hypothetical protein
LQLKCNKTDFGSGMPVQVEDMATLTTMAPPIGEQPPATPKRRNNRVSRTIRRFHFWLGALLTINFIVLVLTGLLVQHRTFFRLSERTVSRKWLPAGYRLHDPDSEIRADIVMTDFHSGKLLGPKGPWIVDITATGLVLMVISGYATQLICRYSKKGNGS